MVLMFSTPLKPTLMAATGMSSRADLAWSADGTSSNEKMVKKICGIANIGAGDHGQQVSTGGPATAMSAVVLRRAGVVCVKTHDAHRSGVFVLIGRCGLGSSGVLVMAFAEFCR
jgi:hypothetical protein